MDGAPRGERTGWTREAAAPGRERRTWYRPRGSADPPPRKGGLRVVCWRPGSETPGGAQGKRGQVEGWVGTGARGPCRPGVGWGCLGGRGGGGTGAPPAPNPGSRPRCKSCPRRPREGARAPPAALRRRDPSPWGFSGRPGASRGGGMVGWGLRSAGAAAPRCRSGLPTPGQARVAEFGPGRLAGQGRWSGGLAPPARG